MLKQYKIKNYRFQLILLIGILSVLGILLVGSAKPSMQTKQIIGVVSGFIIMTIVSMIDYNFILKFSWIFYFGMIGLLVLVKLPGVGKTTGGAQRWINIGGFQFQPSELAKILLILFFAYFFMKHEEDLNTPKVIFLSLLLAGIPLVLILTQPALSTTICSTLIFITLLFVAGLSYKIVAWVLAICLPTGIIGFVLMIKGKIPFIKSYQIGRIMAWLYPDDYPDLAYQQQNSIMAIGSGQLFGKGLNNTAATSVKNGNFILESQTDFIYAVAGEELGFIGTAAIILLLLFLTIECILIARKAKDLSGKLICCGVAALIGFQSTINIFVATGLFPNTGIPLPFISYGLTSLWSLYIGMGLVLNVGLQPKKF